MENILCILIPALVGLICGILGYLLGKSGTRNDDNSIAINLQTELERYKAKLNTCEANLKTCEASLATPKAQMFAETPAVTFLPFDASLVASVFGKKINQDDLKIIEGIGPKIEELYHNAGIKTWHELSQTSVQKSQEILTNAGDRFAIHDPSTWAKQAELAYQGKWQELKDWQDQLDGGKKE